MSNAESNMEVKVGALVVTCLVLLAGFVVLLGDFKLGEAAEVMVDFETSAGLKRGAVVKVSGLTAGRVEQVEFWGGKIDSAVDRPVNVRVHLSMKPDIAETLRADARFYITTIGLLGEKYVEIDPGINKEPLGAAIKTGVPPMRIEVMSANMNKFLAVGSSMLSENRQALNDTMTDIRGAAQAGREVVEQGRDMVVKARKQLDSLMAKSNAVLNAAEEALVEYTPGKGATGDHVKTIAERGSTLVSKVDSNVRAEDIRAIISDIRGVTGRVRLVVDNVSGRVEKLVSKADKAMDEAAEMLAVGKTEVTEVAGKVREVLDGTNSLMAKIRDGEGTIGALLHDREIYDDAREMMKDLKRHPWKFLWKE